MKRFMPFLLGAGMSLALQSCINPESREDSSPSARLELSGNGDGYDGKIFVHVRDSGLCPDGSRVDSLVVVWDGLATLVRDGCRDLPDAERVTGPAVYAADDPSTLIFGDLRYKELHIVHADLRAAFGGEVALLGMGYKTWEGHVPFAARLDAAGEVRWTRRLEDPSRPESLAIRAGLASSGGRLLLAGEYLSYELDQTLSAGYGLLSELDASGEIVWSRRFTTADPRLQKLHFQTLLRTPTGRVLAAVGVGRYIAGNSLPAPDAWDSGWLELGANGEVLSQTWFSGEDIRLAAAASDGDLLAISGNAVVRYTPDGTARWLRQMPFRIAALVPAADNGFYFVGRIGDFPTALPAVARANAFGQIVWARTMRTPDQRNGEWASLALGRDGNLICFGMADRDAVRVGMVAGLSPAGDLLWNIEQKQGSAGRFLRGFQADDGTIWSTFVDANLETSMLNESLRPLASSSAQPSCRHCRARGDFGSEAFEPSVTDGPPPVRATGLDLAPGVPARLRSAPLRFPILLSRQ